MIYITRDCHLNFDKFNTNKLPIQNETTKQDYIIIQSKNGMGEKFIK